MGFLFNFPESNVKLLLFPWITNSETSTISTQFPGHVPTCGWHRAGDVKTLGYGRCSDVRKSAAETWKKGIERPQSGSWWTQLAMMVSICGTVLLRKGQLTTAFLTETEVVADVWSWHVEGKKVWTCFQFLRPVFKKCGITTQKCGVP